MKKRTKQKQEKNFLQKQIETYLIEKEYQLKENSFIQELKIQQEKRKRPLSYSEIDKIKKITKKILRKKEEFLKKKQKRKKKELEKIKKALKNLQKEKEISINKFYSITEKTTEEQIYLLDQEISQLKNEKVFKSFHLSLLNQQKNLSKILKKEQKKEKQQRVQFKNINSSLKIIPSLNLSLFYQELNPIEQLLNQDKIYEKMAEESKILYRKQIKRKRIKEEYLQKRIQEKRHIGFDLFPKKHPLFKINPENVSVEKTIIRISLTITEKKEIDLLLTNLEKIACPQFYFHIINKNQKIEDELLDYGRKKCLNLNQKNPKNHFSWNKKKSKNEKIKYIINLENVIELQMKEIKYLMGILEHPLNKPILNKKKTRVIQNFAILSFPVSYPGNSLYLNLYQKENSEIENHSLINFEIYQEVLKNNPFTTKKALQKKVLKQKWIENIQIGNSLSRPTFKKYIKKRAQKKKKIGKQLSNTSLKEKYDLLTSFKKEILYLLLFLAILFLPSWNTLLLCLIIIGFQNRQKNILYTSLKTINEYTHIPFYLCSFFTKRERIQTPIILTFLFLLTKNYALLLFMLSFLSSFFLDKPIVKKQRRQKKNKKVEKKQIRKQEQIYSFLFQYLSNMNQYPINQSRKKLLNYNTLTEENLNSYHLSRKAPLILLDLDHHSNMRITKEVCLFFNYCKKKNFPINLLILNTMNHRETEEIAYHIYAENETNFKKKQKQIFYLDEEELTKEEIILLYTLSSLTINGKKYSSLIPFVQKLKESLGTIIKENKEMLEIKPYTDIEENAISQEIGIFYKDKIEYNAPNNQKTNLITTLSTQQLSSSLTKEKNWETYVEKKDQKLTKNEEFLLNHQKIEFSERKYGLGYITLLAKTNEIELTVTQFLSTTEKTKLTKITIENTTEKELTFSFQYRLEIVLGKNLGQEARYILATFHKEKNMVILQNKLNSFYQEKCCFITSSERILSSNLDYPLKKEIEIQIYLAKKRKKEFSFTLGIANKNELEIMKEKYMSLSNIENILRMNQSYLQLTLKTIQVKTEDSSFDIMINNWLPYKILNEKIYSKENKEKILDSSNMINIIPMATKQEIIDYAKKIDKLHFLIYALKNYIEKTEDQTILETKVKDLETEKENSIYHKIEEEIENWLQTTKENLTTQNRILSYFIELTKWYDKRIDRKKYEKELEKIQKREKESKTTTPKENELWNLIMLLESSQYHLLYKRLQELNPIHNPKKLNLYNKYSSWIYKISIENILGFQKRGKKLYINPHLPPDIKKYSITYHYLSTTYQIEISPKKRKKIIIDNHIEKTDYIPLKNDYKTHQVIIE